MFTTSQKEVFQPIWMFSFRWLCGGLVLQQTENNEKKFLAETNQENSEQQNLGAKPKNAKKKTTQKHAPDLANLLYKNMFTVCTNGEKTRNKKQPTKSRQPTKRVTHLLLNFATWFFLLSAATDL